MMKHFACVAGIGLLAVFSGGCTAFKASVAPVDVDKAKPMEAKYDYSDLKWLGSASGQDILSSGFLKGLPGKPTFVIMGIQNRTTRHVDTKAITDTMRGGILDAGKANFVNESRRDDMLREKGYQLANCTPETRMAIGKELGANYIISGSLIEIIKKAPKEVRLARKEEVFYQMTLEITDLTTGLITWQKQYERARVESKPIIGW
jgi:uncharacterized protein (TIGR02722 family)